MKNQLDLANSNLFYKILTVISIASCAALLTQIANPNKVDLITSAVFLIIAFIAYLIFKSGYKIIAYHFVPISICLLYLATVVYLGTKYVVILLIYPAGIVYVFIFFNKKYTHLYYLIFLIVNQFVVVYFVAKYLDLFTVQNLTTEYINIVAYNLAIFFMCYYYLKQIKESQEKADKINAELVKNQAYIQIQKNELQRKNTELTSYIESNLQLENFAHLASHELKTPVRNVMNFSNLLERSLGEKLTDKEQEYFNHLSEYTYKMNDLIVDLHKLSSVSKTKINAKEIDVSKMISTIKDELGDLIKSKSAIVNYDSNVDIIKGELNLIRQVFTNLIHNALKFTKKDTTPNISIRSEENEFEWRFYIQDNGIGINPKYKEKIFLIFKRLHSDASFKGTGIGLSICKKIIELHKGEISVQGNDQGGTTFQIKLPKVVTE